MNFQSLEDDSDLIRAGDQTCHPESETPEERDWRDVSDNWHGTRLVSIRSWCPGYIYRRPVPDAEWIGIRLLSGLCWFESNREHSAGERNERR